MLLISAVRAFFTRQGFIEVETPVLCVSPGIDPYIDALGVEGGLFLATSPELHMKRLLAQGLTRIFQVTRAFRAGEKGHLHNPEFTILEWYTAGQTYRDLMADTEELVFASAVAVAGEGLETPAAGWPRPFTRLSVDDAFRKFAGWTPSGEFNEERFFLDLVDKVEPSVKALGPVFLYDFPRALGSLARIKPEDPRVAERFELYVEGLEICNGFTELTDPVEQAERFERHNRERERMGKKPYPVDRRFLEALEVGLPPCAGNALGIDRLLMALTGVRDIREVTAFPYDRL